MRRRGARAGEGRPGERTGTLRAAHERSGGKRGARAHIKRVRVRAGRTSQQGSGHREIAHDGTRRVG
eukprot:560359-Pleurochrysis_carterae.AAC.1